MFDPLEFGLVAVGLIAVSILGLMIAIYCNQGNPFDLDEGDEEFAPRSARNCCCKPLPENDASTHL